MPLIDRSKPDETTAATYEVLDTDVYEMAIDTCTYEQSAFADEKTGEKPWQYVICWHEPETETKIWQRFNPFYGTTKSGAPSKWMAFIDSLVDQGFLPADEPFDPCDLLPGIHQRVSVEKYVKTQGVNKGQEGNKVVSVLPLKPKRPKIQARSQNEKAELDKLDW